MAASPNLSAVGSTPSSALLSTRDKPDNEYCGRIFEVLKAHDVRYFFYICGNDSADTCRIVHDHAVAAGSELRVVHIPKTIDNDLLVTDHCPGFGSAGRFVSLAFAGINLDNLSLPGVYIGVVMGRNAGFLTAASTLARKYTDDGPHLVYVPEIPFETERFISDVDRVFSKYKRCIIAVSEGIADAMGQPVIASLVGAAEKDAHGNVQLSGTGTLGDELGDLVKSRLKIKRVRCDTFGYLQRSFLGCISEVDAREAYATGEKAVQFAALENACGSVAIRRTGDYAVEYLLTPLESVARNTKSMAPEFLDSENSTITDSFKKYALPLIGPLPDCERISAPKVKRILRSSSD
jgi:6-phosphofructokinase